MALIGTALAKSRVGKHIIATKFEHASVNAPLKFLEEMGFSYKNPLPFGPLNLCPLALSRSMPSLLGQIRYFPYAWMASVWKIKPPGNQHKS